MGERFGNYELLEKVAVGGMAEIFKARAIHARGVEKLVCIKRIHPALSADRVFVAMFIDEARLGVSMAHGNIVPVFDFGYVDGHYFLAMEYVEGHDLATIYGRARVVEKPWPPQLAVYAVMEILEGLGYAHQKRDDQGRPLELVHRDVSPSNVLVSNDGQVKLLDFGIARSQAREFETRTGVIKGKPGYMSPEQAAGGTVDARADVWSSGAVLHELLTGARLKDGRVKPDDDLLEIVLDRALSADRDRRYTSARQMQEALASVLAERHWRPYARDLAAFIEDVYAAEAPGENWDMKSTAVEKHLADALENARPEPDDPHHTATARITETVPSTIEPGTALATTTEDRGPVTGVSTRRKGAIAAISVALLAGAVLFFMFFFDDKGETVPGQPDTPSGESTQADSTPPDQVEKAVQVEISSTPPGARISIDGDETGSTTPDTLSLEPGTVVVELTLDGYTPWKQTLSVTSDGTDPVAATLVSAGATLVVETDPPGAQVLVNDEPQGQSPVELTGVEPGEATVLARMEGRSDEQETVALRVGETTRVKLTLAPKPRVQAPPRKRATLNVITQPWSQVILDGKAIGQTPIRNRTISAGKHSIVLKNPVLGVSKKISFSARPGENKLISEKLDK